MTIRTNEYEKVQGRGGKKGAMESQRMELILWLCLKALIYWSVLVELTATQEKFVSYTCV